MTTTTTLQVTGKTLMKVTHHGCYSGTQSIEQINWGDEVGTCFYYWPGNYKDETEPYPETVCVWHIKLKH